jgi:N-acetylmuramoyl-L-alanine amidase
MTDARLDLGAPDHGSSIIGRISRRRMIQGGVAAGVVLAAPVIPLPAMANEKEMAVVIDPVDLSTGTPVSNPLAGHAPEAGMLRTQSVSYRRLPVVETDEFRMVGVSWTGGPVAGAAIRVRRAGTWSEWLELDVDPGEAPDPAEAPPSDRRVSRPVWVDRADAAELVVPDGVADVTLNRVCETSRSALEVGEATVGATPGIHPRSAWNARPHVGTPSINSDVRLAIIHHSGEGSNHYSAADVPAIIRGMQNYHLDAQHWNDIAYNFIVDRFGRIWEGRAGGVDKGVIGGHTYGCNSGTIGVCYIGNLSGLTMPAVAEQAITALLSWKFNQVHAISPGGTTYYAPSASRPGTDRYAAGAIDVHPTVVGHQHFGSTACPGSVATPGRVHSALTSVGDVRGVSPAAGGPWNGMWLVTPAGQAIPHGWTAFYGSRMGAALAAPMISLTPTASGEGYWMLGADGGIFSFGDALFYGSTGAMRLNAPVVGMARTKSGEGYWLVASDGGIFSFGDARFYGSTGAMRLNQPVIGMARTPSGGGYWLFASDGGIFTFGDAKFFGSSGGSPQTSPAVGVAAHPNGSGYWLALANGTVRSFGTAHPHGGTSQPSSDPIVGISATIDGGGYWLAARSGKVFNFGNAT